MKALRSEERNRELAGFYDKEMDDCDDRTKELLLQAAKIKEREDLMRMEFRLKKSVKNQPKIPRRIGRKRERTMDRLENELGALGVDIRKKRMKNFEDEQNREQIGKKIRVGRSRSLSAPPIIPRDEKGIPNKKVSD